MLKVPDFASIVVKNCGNKDSKYKDYHVVCMIDLQILIMNKGEKTWDFLMVLEKRLQM